MDELLVQHGNDTTTEAALGRLFAMWGATYDPSAARAATGGAARARMPVPERILGAASHVESSRDPDADRRIRAHTPGRADRAQRRQRDARCRQHAAQGRDLVGVAILVRRLPAALAATARAAQGAHAGHARGRRALARACAACRACRPRRPYDYYDEELARLVQDFQRQHRLAIDGVAGVQTQIVLDTMLNATGSPTIVGPIAGG